MKQKRRNPSYYKYNEVKTTYSFHQAFQRGILQHEGIKHLLCLLAHIQQDYVVKRDGKASKQSMHVHGLDTETNPNLASDKSHRQA